ncbi:MAG: efflux RND transporter permease subunit, partial [Candidatus Binatia bacterium]
MRSVLRWLVNNPIAIVVAVTAIALAGVYAARHMPVDLFPNLDVPLVNIITHAPGAAPEDVELLVTRPIESQLRSIAGIKRVASTSVQGISQVTAEFSWVTTLSDARQLAQARLAQLRGILPAGISPYLESVGTTLQQISGYIIYRGGDPRTLRSIVQHGVAGRVMAVEGVSSVQVLGGEKPAFYVAVKPEALVRLHLSITDLVTTLQRHNVTAVTGYLDRAGRQYPIRGDGRLRTLDDLRALPVVQGGAQSVLLGAIARVYAAPAPRHYAVRGNALPAVAVIIRKQPGASTVRVAAAVDRTMNSLAGLLPPGTQVRKFYDQSEIIKEAEAEIARDVIIGALLAVVVLYVFLGSLWPTLAVAVTIPISCLATLALMRWFGLGLNVITMTALALGIGLIVDDAIVVAENISRHGRVTAAPQAASVAGTLEVAAPDASGTFTTVAAFLPLLLATGLAALFLRPFGLTLSTALTVSLVLSLTLVPALFAQSKAVPSKAADFVGQRLIHRLDVALHATLRASFRHKLVTLGVAVLACSAAALTVLLGTASFLPPIDEGALLIEYIMPPGTSLAESDRIGDALDRIALSDPGVSSVYRRTGSPVTGAQVEGVNRGELFIKLTPKRVRQRSAGDVLHALKDAYSRFRGVVFLYHQPTQEKIDESLSGLPARFGVTIYGTDFDTLIALANQVEAVLSKDPAITDVINNTKVRIPQINVRMNYPRLAQYGLDLHTVLNTLSAVRFGVEATRIVGRKADIAVLTKMDLGTPLDIPRMKQLPIIGRAGTVVPLRRVADITVTHAPAAVTRLNGQREITLLAEVAGSLPALVGRLRKQLARVPLPQGYSIELSGRYKLLREAAAEFTLTVAAALVLIYLIMAMQFRSWLQPLLILLTIPLSLVGALLGLFV